MKIRWRAKSGDEPLWPSADPLVMIVRAFESRSIVLRGWHLGSPVVARGYDSELVDPSAHDVLTPGGRASIYNRIVKLPADETHPQPFWDSVGIYRVDVATGKHDRAGFDARPARLSHRDLAFGGSPDAASVVIAQNWNLPSAPLPDLSGLDGRTAATARSEWHKLRDAAQRVTISLATFDGAPAREIATMNAHHGTDAADATTIQWSPDGHLVAICLRVISDQPPSPVQVEVFDTTTWEVVERYDNACLAGSACWGPNSDRLLLEHEINTTWVQHLDGSRQPITVLPPRTSGDTRPIRTLGMADNDHLLTVRAPRDRSTLMRTSITDGTHEGIVTWAGGYGTYPVLAQMPPETWD